eukprot:1161277-Pelagomonas_calceolata.AAC.6
MGLMRSPCVPGCAWVPYIAFHPIPCVHSVCVPEFPTDFSFECLSVRGSLKVPCTADPPMQKLLLVQEAQKLQHMDAAFSSVHSDNKRVR